MNPTIRAIPNMALYPFLISAYLVVALASAVGGELASPLDLLGPLLVSLSIAATAWFISALITTDRHKRALLTLAVAAIFGCYGRVTSVLVTWPAVKEFGSDIVALPLTLVLLVAFTDLVRRSERSFTGVTSYLNVVAAVLLLWSSVLFAIRTRGPDETLPIRTVLQTPASSLAGDRRPNFFFLVLDKYTGQRSLKANYGFENTDFLRFLEQRGFHVAHTAHANYNHTFLALAAMLNWTYLDTLVAPLGRDSHSWRALYPTIEDNRLAHTLKQAGYQFIFFPSGFRATAGNRFADRQIPKPSAMSGDFRAIWLRTTIVPPTLKYVCPVLGCSSMSVPYISESAAALDWKFRQIAEVSRSREPVFVFAHLTLPHEPYIYTAACDHRPPYWPDRDGGTEEPKIKAAYVQQVRCTNQKLKALVSAILGGAQRETIIVLQADHGHGRLGRRQPPISEVPPSRVAERMDIFAAYYLPGAPSGLLSDSVGPVNAVRAIMRHYYSLNLPPLAEQSFWSSDTLPYAFTRTR